MTDLNVPVVPAEEAPATPVAAELVPAPPAPPKELTADDILAAHDIEYRDLDIPEWGGPIRLRMLTAAEAIEFTRAIDKNKEDKSVAVKLLIISAVTRDGRQLFNIRHEAALQKKALKVMIRIQNEILEMNGLTEKAGKQAEAAAKND